MSEVPPLILDIAESSEARLPELRQAIEEIVSQVHPIELMCQLASMMMHAGDEFPDKEEMAKRQVRAEFVAWLLLSKPFAAPAEETLIGGQVLGDLEQALDDYIMAYSLSFMTPPAADQAEDAKRSLKFLLQTDAVHVRGEGLPRQITALATGLYSPHEAWMRENLGFSIDDAFDITKSIFKLIAEKFNRRKQEAQQVRQYWRTELDTIARKDQGTLTADEQEIIGWCSEVGPDEVASHAGCRHLFSELRNCLGFFPIELSEAMGGTQSISSLTAFLNRMSQTIGTVASSAELVGFNPLWERPLICFDDRY